MFTSDYVFHHVQEVDDPASDGDSDHTDSEGSVDSKNTCECEMSLSSLSETEKVHVAIDANTQCSVTNLLFLVVSMYCTVEPLIVDPPR